MEAYNSYGNMENNNTFSLLFVDCRYLGKFIAYGHCNKIHTPLDLMQLSALDGHLICKWNIHCLGLFEAKFMK